jgi:hypothetical protein
LFPDFTIGCIFAYKSLAFVLGSDGSGADQLILPAGGSAHPPSLETIEKKMHPIRMNGHEVFKFAARVLGKALQAENGRSSNRPALRKAGLGFKLPSAR